MPDIKSIRLEHITKIFDSTIAVSDVGFEMKQGKVYSIVGENGAGKSTIVKIMNGTYEPSSGEIFINEKRAKLNSPADAADHGIGMVYQELHLLPNLSVTENIFISRLTENKTGIIDWKKLDEKAREYLELFNLKIDIHTLVGKLKVAYQQIVAIIRSYAMNSRVVILDEPTSALPAKDIGMVLDVVRKLVELGCIVVYISHKLDEVLEISDEIIAMRNGRKIGEYHAAEITKYRLIELIAGRSIENKFPKQHFKQEDEILRFEHVTVPGYLEDISFTLYRGEILGFSGLLGAGKTEVAKTILGVFGRNYSGNIYLYGKKLITRSPKDVIAHKIGLVPENRALEGLILEHSVRDNTISASLSAYSRFGLLKNGAIGNMVERLIQSLKIKCPGMRTSVRNLSGGNQQKVVLAKWMAAESGLIIFDEPTRGIDVGAKFEIYNLMNGLVEKGVGIMLMSSEADEVLGMADRVVVLKDGRVKKIINSEEMTEEELLAIS